MPSIKDRFYSIFFKDSSKWQYWILLAILAKLFFFVIQVVIYHQFWNSADADTPGYLKPIENLVFHGSYTPDWRMPGYGVVYMPLILVFSITTAQRLCLIIQLILSSVSVYILALTALRLFGKNIFFYGVFFVFAISSTVCLYDAYIETESFTTSALIFSVFFLVKFNDTKKNIFLVLSGAFLTWVTFLRPIFGVLFVFFSFIITIRQRSKSGNVLISLCLFLIPFALVDGAWSLRNYRQYKAIRPLTTVFPPTNNVDCTMSLYSFMQAWGASNAFFDTTAVGWFYPYFILKHDKMSSEFIKPCPYPEYIYTSKFNKDSLMAVKKMVIYQDVDTALSLEEKNEYNRKIIACLDRYTMSIKTEKPFVYYIVARWNEVKRFFGFDYKRSIWQPRPALYMNRNLALLWILLYSIVMILGGLGCLIMIKYFFKEVIKFLPTGIIIVMTLAYPILLKHGDESRYFVPAYPYMVICFIYAFDYMRNKFIKEYK